MPTQKRRVIYLSDEQWAGLQAQARGERTTISNLIRHGMALIPPTGRADKSPVAFHAPKGSEPLIDPIHWDTAVDTSEMKRVGPAFNSRGSRPVPKGK